MTSARTTATHGWTRFFRDPRTGEVVVAQWPNAPLWIFLIATAVRLVVSPSGGVGTLVSLVAAVGLVWWAADEIVRGASPFRRVAGGLVLLGWLLGLALRLR